MLFKELKELIDMELNQYNFEGIEFDSSDSYRKIHKKEIMAWANQSLQFLSTVNPYIWRKLLKIYTPVNTNVVKLSNSIKRLYKVVNKNGKYVNISYLPTQDSNSGAIAVSNNEIVFNENIDEPYITIDAVVNPSIITDDEDIIDIPQEWERLLILAILNKAAGKLNKKTEVWYSEYLTILKIFKSASATIKTVNHATPSVSF